MHLAPLLECRVDTLKPRDFSDALASAWIECPRIADNVFQRARAIMEWAFAAYPEHVMGNPVPSARALQPSRSARQSKPKHHPAILASPLRWLHAFMRRCERPLPRALGA